MPKVLLALGPVVFRDFELPPEINFGGRQRMAIHRLADGRRVIDCLGREDANIQFSGIFAGPDATLRARALDGMRGSGAVLPLTWDMFFYLVVVEEFAAEYRNESWIPYTLKCAVVRDEAESLIQTVASLAELLSGDVIAAADGYAVPGVDFGALSMAITTPGAVTYGTSEYQSAQDSLVSAKSILAEQIACSESELVRSDLSVAPAQTAIIGLSAATESARQLAWLTRAQGYVGRAVVNLASEGASV